MGQELRRLARFEGKVFLVQDVRQFPFKVIKYENSVWLQKRRRCATWQKHWSTIFWFSKRYTSNYTTTTFFPYLYYLLYPKKVMLGIYKLTCSVFWAAYDLHKYITSTMTVYCFKKSTRFSKYNFHNVIKIDVKNLWRWINILIGLKSRMLLPKGFLKVMEVIQ